MLHEDRFLVGQEDAARGRVSSGQEERQEHQAWRLQLCLLESLLGSKSLKSYPCGPHGRLEAWDPGPLQNHGTPE